MKIENGKAVFSTGTTKNCYGGIIGIDGKGEVTAGYDTVFWTTDKEYYEDFPEAGNLTQDERIELAIFMLDRWNEFKDTAWEEKEND